LTPELIASLRAGMPARLALPQSDREPSPRAARLNWPDFSTGDSWESQARWASEQLLAALRRHHPERCGGR
jgi:hypothetical protein